MQILQIFARFIANFLQISKLALHSVQIRSFPFGVYKYYIPPNGRFRNLHISPPNFRLLLFEICAQILQNLQNLQNLQSENSQKSGSKKHGAFHTINFQWFRKKNLVFYFINLRCFNYYSFFLFCIDRFFNSFQNLRIQKRGHALKSTFKSC